MNGILLEPFKSSTEVLGRQNYPTFSCLAPILKDLRDRLDIKVDDSSVLKAVKSAMINNFNQRYQDVDVKLL